MKLDPRNANGPTQPAVNNPVPQMGDHPDQNQPNQDAPVEGATDNPAGTEEPDQQNPQQPTH